VAVSSLIDVILFDFGGVFTASPFDAVRLYAEEVGIDVDVALGLCFGPYDQDTDHAWHRLERGEVTLTEAREILVELAASQGHDIDPFQVLARMGSTVDDQRDAVVERTRQLRSEGYRTAIITNNVREFGDGWRGLVPVEELFEVIIDSSTVGVRKPDPRIFHLALDALGGVDPDRAVFLDDAAANVAAAQALGIHGVVVGADRIAALDRLDDVLGRS
jgi:putative hydrolase of the HAD superfamily